MTERVELLAWASLVVGAGVRPTLTEWRALTSDEQAALVVAGERDRVALARALALALRGDEGLAELEAPYDGGERKERLALERAVAKVVA